jgi:hypothetical protein
LIEKPRSKAEKRKGYDLDGILPDKDGSEVALPEKLAVPEVETCGKNR